jgi:hypothetical protein
MAQASDAQLRIGESITTIVSMDSEARAIAPPPGMTVLRYERAQSIGPTTIQVFRPTPSRLRRMVRHCPSSIDQPVSSASRHRVHAGAENPAVAPPP